MLLCLGGGSSASAEELRDPTLPPPQAAASPAAATTAAPAAGLQMILRRPGRPPAAVINGEYVELGGRISGSRLVGIGDDSVVLEGPSGRETLVLTPGVVKRHAPAAADDRQKGKSR